MTYKCPQCGKQLDISQNELARNGCRVVCPQCLADFEPEGIDRRAIEALVDKKAEPEPTCCGHCGHTLPAVGLRYCPWCGKSLDTTIDAEPAAPAPQAGTHVTIAEPQQPQQPEPVQEPATRPPLFMPFRPCDVAEPPASSKFRAVCYVVIALLIAAWVTMMWLMR